MLIRQLLKGGNQGRLIWEVTFSLRTGKDQENEHSRHANTAQGPWVKNKLDMNCSVKTERKNVCQALTKQKGEQ